MIWVTHVLCPVDRSEISKLALDHARTIANWYGASLSVVEVVWPGMPPIAIPTLAAAEAGWPLLAPEERTEYERTLDVFCSTVGLEERHEVAEGPIVDVILGRASKEPAQLIVMGTHGRGGFQHAILGSITEKVLRKATCPVLVVPPHLADRPDRPALPYRTILCAIDFSPSSKQALGYALALAQESAATLVLQHVTHSPSAQQLGGDSSLTMCAMSGSVREAAAHALRRLVPEEAKNWCEVRTVVSTGKPHQEIVNAAIGEKADLVVMGVHSRPTLLTPFFGSTANQVVRHARCPVLVVRP